MLAPPQRHRKRKPRAALRADARRYQRDCRKRKKDGLHRCTLWISGVAYEGLIRQLRSTQQLTDKEADDHRRFEAALARLIEAQGKRWAT